MLGHACADLFLLIIITSCLSPLPSSLLFVGIWDVSFSKFVAMQAKPLMSYLRAAQTHGLFETWPWQSTESLSDRCLTSAMLVHNDFCNVHVDDDVGLFSMQAL